MTKRREDLAEKRSKRQCSSGNPDLDRAISWFLKIGFEDGWDACQKEMQSQTPNALKFLRERVVGFQASRNVFRVIDEEIKKYDQSYEPQTGSQKRKQFVTDRNDLIQELRTENDSLKDQLKAKDAQLDILNNAILGLIQKMRGDDGT